ncbi:MAG: hypothetical protein GC159_16300 [Phycisphaera sp.]|nr:hypothetical protein [Phycisphaera sp.]
MLKAIAPLTGLVLALVAGTATADVVNMKDGREFIGKIVAQKDDMVVLDAMVAGIRATLRLSRQDIASVVEDELPEGFFDPPKPANQPATTGEQAVDAETKAQVNGLNKDILSLRKELAEYSKRLRSAPETVRKVYRTGISGGSRVQPLNSVAVDEPNPQIPIFKEKIQKTRDAITAKQKEIANLMNPAVNAERSESEVVVSRLQMEIAAHRKALTDLQKTLANTPPKTELHRVRPGQTVGDLFRKRDPEPNPEYLALQKQINEVRDLIAVKNKQALAIKNGGDAGDAVLDAIQKAEALAAAGKAQRAATEKRRLTDWAKRYDTPEKAADLCVKDLMARGIIKMAIRTGVGQIEGEKARWTLTSGQWATAQHGVGIVAPGAPLPESGPPRRPGARGAQVSYVFTFTTQVGLLRENSGYVLVAYVDGFWEPWGYSVDGIAASPYTGRAAYVQAHKSSDAPPDE